MCCARRCSNSNKGAIDSANSIVTINAVVIHLSVQYEESKLFVVTLAIVLLSNLILLTRWSWKYRRAALAPAGKKFLATRCSWKVFRQVGSSSAWPSWRWSTCPPGGSGHRCRSCIRVLRGKTPSGHSHAPLHFPGRRSRWSWRYRRRIRSSVLLKVARDEKNEWEKEDMEGEKNYGSFERKMQGRERKEE